MRGVFRASNCHRLLVVARREAGALGGSAHLPVNNAYALVE
ncbi:MAG: hypothetical protein ACRDGA_04735 [Bacteroidota bacterium]